jgi:pimeloyl-ACP methyl ester carboxylesterase
MRSAVRAVHAVRAALTVIALVTLVPSARGAAVHEYRVLELPDGRALRHALVLPDGFRPDGTYPVLLALPGGRQDEAAVEAGLARHWGVDAARRGWLVVSPVAPAGSSFLEGAEDLLPALLDVVSARYRVEGGCFHVAGADEGGLSAFRFARLHPESVCSLVALPGGPATPEDEHQLAILAGIPLRIFAAGGDTRWVILARRSEATLRALGSDVRVEILPGRGPEALAGVRVLETLDVLRQELGLPGSAPPDAPGGRPAGVIAEDPIDAVGSLLDGFHDAAARADEAAYLAAFAPGAIFLGTDGTERWTLDAFSRFVRPRFAAGRGWRYVPRERHVFVDDDRRVAWFDELLDNERYGECRGVGVAVRRDGRWLVAQYALSLTVPNHVATSVVDLIGGRSGGPTR